MKIVHIVPALTKGGGERVAVDLANAAARAGHEVCVLAAWKVDEALLRVRLDPSVTVRYMAETRSGVAWRYASGLWWLLRNREWLASHDVLHCHLTQAAVYGAVIYTLRQLFRSEKPAVVETYHSVGMPISDRTRQFHARLCTRRDGLVLMATDRFWSDFKDNHRGFPIHVIPNGIDSPEGREPPERVAAFRRAAGVPDKATFVVGNVGQFRPDRDPMRLLDVFIRLVKRTPEHVHVLMCGSGSELDAARAIVAAEGLQDRITLPGVVNDPRLAMSAMALYVSMNVGPITGIAGLEAAITGVPLIALQLNRDYAIAAEDWIPSYKEAEDLSKAACDLIEDGQRRQSLSAAQQTYAIDHFGIGRMMSSYMSFYSDVLTPKRIGVPEAKHV